MARKEISNADALTGHTIEAVVLETPNASGRFVKIVARNFGKIPSGAAGEGNGAWIFLDEIIIE